MEYIEAAYRGRVKMMQTLFGRPQTQTQTQPPARPSKRKLTPALFDAVFARRK